jgi:multidrug transporter EmrE-like cation transporter
MDVNSLRTGEKIAGASGVVLLIVMFLSWWGAPGDIGNLAKLAGVDVDTSANAWQLASFLDIIWFLTAVSGIVLAVIALQKVQTNLPVALSAIVAGLGILSTLTILYRILDTPYDAGRKFGVFLGLIAAAGVAYGGFVAMQEEGTSFSDQADRLQGNRGNNPPPPPAA